MERTIRLIRGLPGSGKSTYAKGEFFGGMLVLEADQYFVTPEGKYKYVIEDKEKGVDFMRSMAATAMSQGVSFVVSGVFAKKSQIDVFKHLAETYEYKFDVACMHGTFKNVHGISEDQIREIEFNFEEYPGEIHITPDAAGGYTTRHNKGDAEDENS